MSILNKLYLAEAQKSWETFDKLCENPQEAQKEVLKDILSNANKSVFFREHSLSASDSPSIFQDKVKITNWDDYLEYSKRMQNCESDLVFNGKPELFVMTSGTSSKPKLIPETKNSIKAKSITEKLKQYFLIGFDKSILKGKFFPLVNKAILGKTPCGIPLGTASGITLANTPENLKKQIAYPLEIIAIKDVFSLDYLMMRFALEEDVRLIVGNNLARMEKLINIAQEYVEKICNDIENGTIDSSLKIDKILREKLTKDLKPNKKRAEELKKLIEKGKFTPSNYWKNLHMISCWLSGSVGIITESVKKLFPDNTIYFDFGYGASEGKFNIPYKPQNSSGILTIHSAFYEFIPIEKENKILLAHEVKKDELYRLIITTYSGLYRYDMKDIVRVTGFFKNTPLIEFVSKTADIGNIAGEKLSASTLRNALLFSAQKFGIRIRHFCAAKVKKPPHYIFCIELEDHFKVDKDEFVRLIDNELKKDIGYGNRRREGVLKEPELKIMKHGWRDKLIKNKQRTGLTEAQIKLAVFYDEIPHREEILT